VGVLKAISGLFGRGRGLLLLQRAAQQFQQSRFDVARRSAEQALIAFRQSGFRWGEEAALGNLGLIYYETGEPHKAIACYDESLKIIEEINDRQGRVRTLGYLGAAYTELGQYAKAIEYQQRSLQLTAAINDKHGLASALGNLSQTYMLLGEYRKALEYADASLTVVREIGYELGEVRVLSYQGVIHNALSDTAAAIQAHKESLSLARDIGDQVGAGRALTNLGALYMGERDTAKAAKCFEQSLAVKRGVSDRKGEVSALGNLALIYLSKGDSGKAIAQLLEVLELARGIGDPRLMAMSLTQLGVALLSSGEPQAAEDTLRQAVSIWETTRAGLGVDDQNKVSLFERQEITYRALQQALVAQQKYDEALAACERGRARALVEVLSHRLTPAGGVMPAPVSPSPQQIREIAASEQATLVEYSISYRDLDALKDGEQRTNEIYIWVISPAGDISFRAADLTPFQGRQHLDVAALVGGARAALGVPERDLEYVPVSHDVTADEDADFLHYVYRLLIQPVANLLPADPNSRVIFIPHRELAAIPFPALQDADGKYLIKSHTVLTAPSIQTLDYAAQAARRHAAGNAGRGALVVGNPLMPKVSLKPGEDPVQLSSLPYAEQEALKVAESLKTEPLIGPSATKANVVGRMPGQLIIHLATHGLLDLVGYGMPGAVVLTPAAGDDGLLKSEEILDLSLDAELVVLSACNTGQGRMTGDGVVGLARAFIAAGVPSVVVSLWSVADDSTAFLMTRFYEHLRGGCDKAAALRNAMLDTSAMYPHPRDWAPFTLVGRAV
jgi:CHAT domain-containing protein/tetratricopeptide (TPR) repeat protein